MPIPVSKQNKERRQKLLGCALSLFAEKGYFDTPVREIIVQSGFGTGTFYNYFSDKEDILKALLEEFAEQIITGVANYFTTEKDLYKRFIETRVVMMEVMIENEMLSDVYSRVAGASPAIDQCLKEFEDKMIGLYFKTLSYGINKGVFNDFSVPPVAHALLAVDKFLLYKWVVLKAITKEEMIEMIVSFQETLAKGLVRKG